MEAGAGRIEDALVPSFIIEELGDGRLTVFVPSIPTPLAGAVYVLPRERVHPVDVPFTQALQTVPRWGSGRRRTGRRDEAQGLLTLARPCAAAVNASSESSIRPTRVRRHLAAAGCPTH